MSLFIFDSLTMYLYYFHSICAKNISLKHVSCLSFECVSLWKINVFGSSELHITVGFVSDRGDSEHCVICCTEIHCTVIQPKGVDNQSAIILPSPSSLILFLNSNSGLSYSRLRNPMNLKPIISFLYQRIRS